MDTPPPAERASPAPEPNRAGVFVSYRRDDSAGHAGRLGEALIRRYGPAHVFLDVESIELGGDFVEAIGGALERCAVLLALIGPRWSSASDSSGRRRLEDPSDPVRRELELAMEHGVRIVPVLLQGAAMPDVDDLPHTLKQLVRCQAFELSDRLWEESRRVLLEALARWLDEPGTSSPVAMSGSAELPSTGLITFLFTEVAGSSAAWEAHPTEMAAAMARHDELVEENVHAHGGQLVGARADGDSRFAVFDRTVDGLAAAVSVNRAVVDEPWSSVTPITLRIAVHTGTADVRAGHYSGPVVNRCARLRALAHPGQALTSAVTMELATAAGGAAVGLTDLGVHWLEDLSQPERVFQVDPRGTPTAFPPLRSTVPSGASAPLPVPSSPPIGRVSDVAEVARLCSLAVPQIVTLTGPGGVGKTTLGIEAAREAAPQFAGGTVFVDLAPTSDPELLLPAIASAIDLPESGEQPLVDQLAARLGSQPTLLVLDNLEHLVDGAADVAALCAAAPKLAILGTSRVPLRVTSEVEYPVQPLPVPGSAAGGVDAMMANEAVALFVERCRAHRPGFTLTAANAPEVAEICRRLDGLPLAIELAAARSRLLDPAGLLSRLDDRLSLLVGGGRDTPQRQRTLRATLAWSHDLLDPPQQRLLARLSVFAEWFSLEAAESVCRGDTDDPPVLDLLADLLESNLVRSAEESTRLRFGLLQTVREFAAERLTELGEFDDRHDCHAQWVLDRVEVLRHDLDGPEAPMAFSEMRAEETDVRAALARLIARDPERAARLTVALRPFWIDHGRMTEGRASVGALLRVEGLDPAVRGSVSVVAGMLAECQDSHDEAMTLLTAGLRAAATAGDTASEASARCFLARACLATGEIGAAREHAEVAHTLARSAGLYESEVQSLAVLAMAAAMVGDFEREHRLHSERLARVRAQRDAGRTADVLNTLAEIDLDDGKWQSAGEHAAEALELAGGTSRFTTRDALLSLARVALAVGDKDRARDLVAQALDLSVEFGQAHELALCLRVAGAIAAADGLHEQAARVFGAAGGLVAAVGEVFPYEEDLAAHREASRAALGEIAFEAGAEGGAQLTRDQAVAEVAVWLGDAVATTSG